MTGPGLVEGSKTPAYAGLDRRGLGSRDALARQPFLVAGGMLVLLTVAFAALAAFADVESAINIPTVVSQLAAASVALAAVLAGLLGLRWRTTGDAPALWVACSAAVIAVFTVGLADLLPLAQPTGVATAAIAWVRPASLVVAMGLLACAAVSPDVDTRVTPRSLLLSTLGALGGLTLLLQILPGASRLVAGGADPLPDAATSMAGPGLVAVALLGLAVLHTVRGIKNRRVLFAWVGLMLLGLALAELARALAPSNGAVWLLGEALLRTTALLVGVLGATTELKLAFTEQSHRLLQTHVDSLANKARIEAEHAAQQERAHEARNALAAIEGATLTLERHREALDPGTRAALAAAVTNEIARLQRLVSAERAEGGTHNFNVSDIVRAQLILVRTQGALVMADVPDGLFANGRPADTAEVLQNLLINAHRHADGSPIVVRGSIDGGRAIIRVEDRGPGVPENRRETIFSRGVRASEHATGSGLGLYVSAQLMKEQGGDLWLENRQGGGSCFAFSLPVGDSSGFDAALPEQVGEQPGEVLQTAQLD